MAFQAGVNERKSAAPAECKPRFPYMATGEPNLAGGWPARAAAARQRRRTCCRDKSIARRAAVGGCLEAKMLGAAVAAVRSSIHTAKHTGPIFGVPRYIGRAASARASCCTNHGTVNAAVLYCAPDCGAEYCDARVCLSVSVCVCPRSYLGTTRPIFTKSFCACYPAAVARSSSGGVVIRCVLPVLWMTSCLHISQGCSPPG